MRPLFPLGLGGAAVFVGILDLTSRFVLGHDLLTLARSAGSWITSHALPKVAQGAEVGPRSNDAPVAADAPVVTTLESERYTIMAIAPASCARGPACTVTLTVEPSPGRHLVPFGPYAFRPEPNSAFAYDAPPGKIMALERTVSRAVVTVPARLVRAVGGSPEALEGKVRV